MSFSKWVNPEGAKKVAKRRKYSFKELSRVNANEYTVRELLDYWNAGNERGVYNILSPALVWSTTPQGHNYWSNRDCREEEFDEDDLAFFEELLEVLSGERTD